MALSSTVLLSSFYREDRRRRWHPTPVLLPGKSHGSSSQVGCSPWGPGELDTIERLHFHFSLSCIGEGNGSPLQCSFLENPRDGGAWWAAIYGVAQSQTQLKRLSSSSSGACVLSHFSRVQLFATLWTVVLQVLCPWNSPGKNTGVGYCYLLQGIFLTLGWNLSLVSPAMASRLFTTSAT